MLQIRTLICLVILFGYSLEAKSSQVESYETTMKRVGNVFQVSGIKLSQSFTSAKVYLLQAGFKCRSVSKFLEQCAFEQKFLNISHDLERIENLSYSYFPGKKQKNLKYHIEFSVFSNSSAFNNLFKLAHTIDELFDVSLFGGEFCLTRPISFYYVKDDHLVSKQIGIDVLSGCRWIKSNDGDIQLANNITRKTTTSFVSSFALKKKNEELYATSSFKNGGKFLVSEYIKIFRIKGKLGGNSFP